MTLWLAISAGAALGGAAGAGWWAWQVKPPRSKQNSGSQYTHAEGTVMPSSAPRQTTSATGVVEQRPEKHPVPKTSHHAAQRTSLLTSLSDGQRYVLTTKLQAHSGNNIRLVLVGNDPQANIVFEQLVNIFQQSGWKLETQKVQMVVSNRNFPDHPYLTGSDMAAPILQNVFSIFTRVGIDLPLTPDAYMGSDHERQPHVVTVVR